MAAQVTHPQVPDINMRPGTSPAAHRTPPPGEVNTPSPRAAQANWHLSHFWQQPYFLLEKDPRVCVRREWRCRRSELLHLGHKPCVEPGHPHGPRKAQCHRRADPSAVGGEAARPGEVAPLAQLWSEQNPAAPMSPEAPTSAGSFQPSELEARPGAPRCTEGASLVCHSTGRPNTAVHSPLPAPHPPPAGH